MVDHPSPASNLPLDEEPRTLDPRHAPTAPRTNRPLVAELRRRIDEALGPLVDPAQPVALLDFPDHGNPGDAAIWLGTTHWLRLRGHEVVYLSDREGFSMSALRRRIGRGTVLLHGGGNFGPLYREHHDFREHVIAGAAGTRVVMMPQTLEFGADAFLADAAAFLRRYPNVTALARDERSWQLLREQLGDRVALCPDMALTLDLPAGPPPAQELVGILRRDREAASGRPGDDEARPWITDWVTSDWHRRDLRLRYRATVRATNASRRLTSARLYDRNAAFVLGRGLDVLGTGRVAVSDRLHVHILSVLTDKAHVMLDNSYGKVSAFRRAWTDPAPTAHWATDLADAERQARALAAAA